jgi:hypothetical protein
MIVSAGAVFLSLTGCQRDAATPTPDTSGPATTMQTISADEAKTLARDAWVFGLPLVYISTQIDLVTHVTRPDATRAPLNQFVHYRQFPDASNKTVVGLNVDTLYSLASLDLSQEPMVLSVPPMGNRFWVMQIIDAWNNVPHAPGSRTLGEKGGNFALVGPNWKGTLPEGVTELRVPTNFVMIGGRTYTAGPDDYAAVHALQDQYKLVPLSQWGKPYTPTDNVPLKPDVADTPVPTQVLAMSPQDFFSRLNALMEKNPPYPEDTPMLERIAKLGIGPGKTFNMESFTPEVRKAIEEGVADGVKLMNDTPRGKDVNGWRIALDLGRYGTKYPYRAGWTFYGVGGNLAEDAVYPFGETQADGKPFDGAHKYELHFTQDQIPPVNAFWSVTMYDKDSYLVPNAINRYALGDRSGMKVGGDGSLTIYIQPDSPGKDKESNWLPSPKEGPFKLALRLYSPKKQVADGTWTPPAVKQVD